MKRVYPFQVPAKEQTAMSHGPMPRGNFRVTTHDELNRAGRAGENQLAELVAAQDKSVVQEQMGDAGLTPEQAAVEFSLDE